MNITVSLGGQPNHFICSTLFRQEMLDGSYSFIRMYDPSAHLLETINMPNSCSHADPPIGGDFVCTRIKDHRSSIFGFLNIQRLLYNLYQTKHIISSFMVTLDKRLLDFWIYSVQWMKIRKIRHIIFLDLHSIQGLYQDLKESMNRF